MVAVGTAMSVLATRVRGWLSRLWEGSYYGEIQHPDFGRMRLSRLSHHEFWEAEPAYEGRVICLAFNTADAMPPSEAQLRFFRWIVEDLDAAFLLAEPLIRVEYEKVYGPLQGSWRDTFTFSGLDVPVDGDPGLDWAISFDTVTNDLLTCRFVSGAPARLTFDR